MPNHESAERGVSPEAPGLIPRCDLPHLPGVYTVGGEKSPQTPAAGTKGAAQGAFVGRETGCLMIAWDPSLATGNAMIDGQHRELYRIVNELHEACVDGLSQDRIDLVLDRLLNYTIEHFAAEESLMTHSDYPPLGVKAHFSQHADLKRRVGKLIEQRENGELTTAMPVVELVHEWLGTHINCTDRRLAEYIRLH
jgi:hemerythrin